MSQGSDVLVSRLRCTGEISFIADVFGSESQGPLGRAELTPPSRAPGCPIPAVARQRKYSPRILLALGASCWRWASCCSQSRDGCCAWRQSHIPREAFSWGPLPGPVTPSTMGASAASWAMRGCVVRGVSWRGSRPVLCPVPTAPAVQTPFAEARAPVARGESWAALTSARGPARGGPALSTVVSLPSGLIRERVKRAVSPGRWVLGARLRAVEGCIGKR